MSNLLSVWRRFITSNNLRKNAGNPSEERLSANLLSSLLTATGLILILVVVPRHFMNPTPDLYLRVLITIAGGLVALIASYICRRGHHVAIANAAVFAVPLWAIIASTTRNNLDALLPLYYLSPIFIFVSLFLTERMMQVSFVVNTLTLIASIALLPSVPLVKFIEGPFSFHLIVSVLTMLMVRHRTALEALRQRNMQDSEARFRSVIDLSQDEFYLFTAVYDTAGQVKDFKLIDSNMKAAAELDQFPATSTTDRLLSNVKDAGLQKRLFVLYKSVLATGQSDTSEVGPTTNGITKRWYYRQVLRTGDGVAVLMRDITAEKVAEQRSLELGLQREKVSILHNFIQAASHDLRTPLAVMRTSTYLLNALAERLRKLLLDDDLNTHRADLDAVSAKMQQNTEQVVKSSERLHRLIEDMLEMTSLDYQTEFCLIPHALNSIIRTLIDKSQSMAARKNLTLTYTLPDQSPQVNVEETAFTHALEHVLNNAIQFTPAGGQVTLNILQQDDKIGIEIKDTGIGIAADEMPRIFERFYRADRARQQDTGGTGLGLPIAQKIIEEHGGKITVESQEGQGTTFRVWLPAITTPTIPAPNLTTQPAL